MSDSDDTGSGTTYATMDELFGALRQRIDSFDDLTGFKIHLFLGRGVHKYHLADEGAKAEREVARLELQLAHAKAKLATIARNPHTVVNKKRERE